MKSNCLSPLAADTNTLCLDGDPMDESRSIIHPNIDLEESLRPLKFCRNELSPISRLPVEILCKIFKFSESQAQTPWTNFSQVSQHWRSSALSAPDLWTNIPLDHPRWALEMLIRSKKANLTANLTIPCHPSPKVIDPKINETVRSCLYEMDRIEKIDFRTIPGEALEEYFRDCPKSAPQLHTLYISSDGKAFSIDDDFLYDTELLRHVELINCKISWNSQLLTGLTCLKLQDSLKANSSIVQVLHALQRMPALTELYLGDSIPDDSEGLSTYSDIDLPCLRILDISSGVSALTAVLRHITFPCYASLNLICRIDQSTHISNFLSVLATKFLLTLVIRRLSLQVPNTITHDLKFYLWTTALIEDCFPASQMSQSQLQLVLEWHPSQLPSYVEALTYAFDLMSLSSLTHLQISTSDHIDSQTWVMTFGMLPLLEQVCVEKHTLSPFLEALVYKTKGAEESEAAYRSVSFPKLRYIHLEGTEFYESLIDLLLDCLMERYERNAEIQVLRLDDCYDISSVVVERLKEVVVDVIWDGLQQQFYGFFGHCLDSDYDSDSDTPSTT